MDNLLTIISDYITINFKSLLLNCDTKNRINYIQTLVKLLPDKQWNWGTLSRNPNITLKFYTENINKKWDLSHLLTNDCINNKLIINHLNDTQYYRSGNPATLWNIIASNFDRVWNWPILSRKMLPEVIAAYPTISWDWCEISINPYITYDFIIVNLDKPWDLYKIMYHECIIPDVLINEAKLKVIWRSLSKNPNLTWGLICANLDKPWKWKYISRHKCVTLDIITKNTNLPWEWKNISKNPNLTWEFICANLNKPWNWKYISRHKCVTLDIITKNTNLPWNWYYMVFNPNICWDFIMTNIDKNWYWYSIGRHIHYSIINKYKDLPYWEWDAISANQTLSVEFVLENIDKLDMMGLSMNTFEKDDYVIM